MEYRVLGSSGLNVPALSFGTGTFGGNHPFFGKWGNSTVEQANRIVDICLDAGANLFDTADVYSFGQSEEILGQTISGQRDEAQPAYSGGKSRRTRRRGGICHCG